MQKDTENYSLLCNTYIKLYLCIIIDVTPTRGQEDKRAMVQQKKKKETPSASSEFSWTNIIDVNRKDTGRFVGGIICVAIALFLFVAMVSFLFTGGADQSLVDHTTAGETREIAPQTDNIMGPIGAMVAQYLINSTLGIPVFLFTIWIFSAGLQLIRPMRIRLLRHFLHYTCIAVWSSIVLALIGDTFFGNSFIRLGGLHGQNMSKWISDYIGVAGLLLVLLATAIIYMVCVWDGTKDIFRKTWFKKNAPQTETETVEETAPTPEQATVAPAPAVTPLSPLPIEEDPEPLTAYEDEQEVELTFAEEPIEPAKPIQATASVSYTPKPIVTAPITPVPATEGEPTFEIEVSAPVESTKEDLRGDLSQPYNPRLDLENYQFPTLDLLESYNDDAPNIDMEEQKANKDRIIEVLRSFGVEITSIKASVGPTITLYEITPAEGQRISRIRNLEDDIALSLSALGIRIIAPIPGKGTVGIEVPNKNPRIVSMSSILSSKRYQESTYELPVAFGKTITNEVFMVDLAKAPHMLVAGATGQGKSVGLNAIVTSLLYKKHPSELKFVIIDPKKVEFAIYAPIEKHYLAKLPDEGDAIITDVTKVVQTLNSLCVEMDTRYDLLRQAGCRNIKEYNAKFTARQLNPNNGHRFLPYIVIIIDEFGDLIMTAGKEVELPICRIAQLARAVGIHAIIATQRPTTNIITGTIKANFPARVAFRVAAMTDSRTILDKSGAQQLIGKGDMLYLQGSDTVRVQCAFVDTPEVERISTHISQQQGYPTAFMLPEYVDENTESSLGEVDMNKLDPLFEEAARLLIYHQQGSTSLIQRKFSIGYNRAGRLMDQLEKAGIVGPANGSKARDVLCLDENDLQMRMSNLNT